MEFEQTVKQLYGQDTQQIILQKKEGLPVLFDKKLQKGVTVQYTREENEQSELDANLSFHTAKLDESGIDNQPQRKIFKDESEYKSQNSSKNAPKEEVESIYQNQDNSFIRNMELDTQNFHKQFIYSNDGINEFQNPNISKQDKQNQFLSQLTLIQKVIKNQEQFQNRQLDVKKQLDAQQTKIFQKIKEFSIGNYKYETQNGKYQKKYIPLFPQLYLKNNINKKEPGKYNEFTKYNVDYVDCFFYNKFGSKKQNQNEQIVQNQDDDQVNEQRKFPTHIQLKFTIDNKDFKKGSREHKVLIDQLIQEKCEEDVRSQPDQENIDFESLKIEKQKFYEGKELKILEREIKSKRRDFQLNIKLLNSRLNINFAPKIYYQYDQNIEGNLGNFDMVIEQQVPGDFMEGKQEGANKNYTKWYNALSPLQYDNDLINYWNLKQVIFIRGQKCLDFDPEIYLKTLVEQELIQSFENQIPQEYNFSHVNNTFEEGTYEDEVINQQNFDSLKKDLKEIKELGKEFNLKINQLAMPLRLSIMVLISNQRVQIFDRNVVDLIDYLQSEKYWNNDFPQKFEYKQYQIAIEQLFFKTGILIIEKPLEQEQLIKIINDYIDSIHKDDNSPLSFYIKEQTRNPNKLAQRRIWMTPTVKIIRPMELDQSNPLLRQLKYVIEYFVRINIMNDNFQDFFFNNEMQNNLLQQFVQPIIKEINFCGIKYKFLNYSASQIKQKSWWQLIDNHGFHLKQEESDATDMSKQISLIKNRETLLNFMGKFNDPKQLKQLARQGQSMSSSIFICNVEFENIRIIEDIRNQDYAFTDGCGYISQEVMDKVCEIFNFYKASAIQMRYSGFKGVLIVHPDLGKVSQENSQKIDILFSAGMKKFEGNMKQLSVIRCATFSPGFLNRQVILILSHLGVKDEVFIQKNGDAIERLDIKKALGKLYKTARKIREMEQNNVQISFKQMQQEMSIFFGPSKQFKPIFIRALLLCNKYTESILVKEGDEVKPKKRAFEIDQEPIFEQILLNMVLSQAQILKKKQRIRLRESAVLIGVCEIHNQIKLKINEQQEPIKQEILNELNGDKYSHLLKENEIFCQIEPLSFQKSIEQEKKLLKKGMKQSLKADIQNAKQICKDVVGGVDANIQILKGPVLITKNPCGHEGDIRLAHAIDESHPAYEKLKHLENVIVFPLQGTRPLQNQMSGGDLDGDVYMIIWDKEIVEQATQNKIPPPSQDDQIILDNHTEDVGEGGFDFSETICKYFKRDLLGFLSNLHLKLALQTSLNDEDTVIAGLLCQVQVDFAKHGRCVKIDIIQDLKKKVKGIPKFLADEKEQYEKLDVIDCSHVIQKLYDQVDLKNMFTDCLKKEHDFSILQKYTFSKFIIDINSEGKISEFLDLKYADYLTNLYLTLVYPMESELKKNLLVRYKILNEGELFCSDFKYRFSDDKQNDYIGALGKSDEDLVRDISQELDDIIKKYRKEFENYCKKTAAKEYPEYLKAQEQKQKEQEEEKSSQVSSEKKKKSIMREDQFLEQFKVFQAKCLYFASYFHLQNEQSHMFFQKMQSFVQNSENPNYKKGFKLLCNFAKEKSLKESEWIAEYCQEFNLSHAKVLREKFQNQNESDMNMDSMIVDLEQYDQKNLQVMRDELKSFKIYKQICKKAECDNLDKINLLWSFKKILSVPWLIAYDYILV